MKKGMLLDNDTIINTPFFKELFEKWKIELIIHNNSENFLIKFNKEKPDFVLLSSDFEIEYKKFIEYISAKKCFIILFGSKKDNLKNIKDINIKGIFPPPIEMDIIQLQSLFLTAEMLQDDLLSESISHIDLVTKEKIGIIELEGNISWEKMHILKYHTIQLYTQKDIKGTIFIFQYLEKSDHILFENIQHLFSFIPQLNLPPSLVQVIAIEERIKTMIRILPYFAKIDFSDSYADAYFRIQGKDQLIKKTGISVSNLNEKSIFNYDLYSEFGELIKVKNENFTKDELAKFVKQGIHKLYSEKELSSFGELPQANLIEDKENLNFNHKDNDSKSDKKVVLIIDDDSITLKLLKKVLTMLNFEVETASTGVEGFQYITENEPDLLLVDLMMPGFNGVDFIKTYKEIKGKEAAPIIVISGITKKEVIIPLIERGVKDYIIKPIQIELLMSKINKIIL